MISKKEFENKVKKMLTGDGIRIRSGSREGAGAGAGTGAGARSRTPRFTGKKGGT